MYESYTKSFPLLILALTKEGTTVGIIPNGLKSKVSNEQVGTYLHNLHT
jgi:hypothetical protein